MGGRAEARPFFISIHGNHANPCHADPLDCPFGCAQGKARAGSAAGRHPVDARPS